MADTHPQITLYQAFAKNSNRCGINDPDVIKKNFVKFAVSSNIGFKVRNGDIVMDNPEFIGVDFIDILVKINKNRGLSTEEILVALYSINANFDFDGKNIVSAGEHIPLITRKNPPVASQPSVVNPMVKSVPQPVVEKRPAEQNAPAKRIQLASITTKKTIELCAFEYQKDKEAHLPLSAIQNKFGHEYSFVLNNNSSSVEKHFAIQIIFSDILNFPKNLGIVRVGILDSDEAVPQFMLDAGCYIYLRYDYKAQKFTEEHNGLKRLGKLFTLNNETVKNFLPDAVVKRRTTHSQSSEQ